MSARKSLSTRERFQRMFAHQEADRVPIIDGPWGATIERWRREGLPENVDWVDFFDVDHVGYVGADISPRFERKTIEETEDYKIETTSWGATMKNFKHTASTPQFFDFRVKTRADWEQAKARMTPNRDRVNWEHLAQHYREWRDRGDWIVGGLWFGFDVTHSHFVGTERLLTALMAEPEWCVDMFNHFLDMGLAHLEMIWQEGYTFDCVMWPDDLGYRNGTFFSVATYRDLLKPVQRRAVEWAHAKGIKAHLHSCGNVTAFVSEFVDIGIDALNPLEVKAGMDVFHLKRTYGDRLVLHGGINAVLWDDLEAIEAEMRAKIPVLKESGGYIFSSDHSIPSSVSLQGFRHIVRLAKELGSYE